MTEQVQHILGKNCEGRPASGSETGEKLASLFVSCRNVPLRLRNLLNVFKIKLMVKASGRRCVREWTDRRRLAARSGAEVSLSHVVSDDMFAL